MGDRQGDEAIRAGVGDAGLNLPPGFRFHPSDEEIITFYLKPKVLDGNFTTVAIGEADINNSEPWELPSKNPFQYIAHLLCVCSSLFVN